MRRRKVTAPALCGRTALFAPPQRFQPILEALPQAWLFYLRHGAAAAGTAPGSAKSTGGGKDAGPLTGEADQSIHHRKLLAIELAVLLLNTDRESGMLLGWPAFLDLPVEYWTACNSTGE